MPIRTRERVRETDTHRERETYYNAYSIAPVCRKSNYYYIRASEQTVDPSYSYSSVYII